LSQLERIYILFLLNITVGYD